MPDFSIVFLRKIAIKLSISLAMSLIIVGCTGDSDEDSQNEEVISKDASREDVKPDDNIEEPQFRPDGVWVYQKTLPSDNGVSLALKTLEGGGIEFELFANSDAHPGIVEGIFIGENGSFKAVIATGIDTETHAKYCNVTIDYRSGTLYLRTSGCTSFGGGGVFDIECSLIPEEEAVVVPPL